METTPENVQKVLDLIERQRVAVGSSDYDLAAELEAEIAAITDEQD